MQQNPTEEDLGGVPHLVWRDVNGNIIKSRKRSNVPVSVPLTNAPDIDIMAQYFGSSHQERFEAKSQPNMLVNPTDQSDSIYAQPSDEEFDFDVLEPEPTKPTYRAPVAATVVPVTTNIEALRGSPTAHLNNNSSQIEVEDDVIVFDVSEDGIATDVNHDKQSIAPDVLLPYVNPVDTNRINMSIADVLTIEQDGEIMASDDIADINNFNNLYQEDNKMDPKSHGLEAMPEAVEEATKMTHVVQNESIKDNKTQPTPDTVEELDAPLAYTLFDLAAKARNLYKSELKVLRTFDSVYRIVGDSNSVPRNFKYTDTDSIKDYLNILADIKELQPANFQPIAKPILSLLDAWMRGTVLPIFPGATGDVYAPNFLRDLAKNINSFDTTEKGAPVVFALGHMLSTLCNFIVDNDDDSGLHNSLYGVIYADYIFDPETGEVVNYIHESVASLLDYTGEHTSTLCDKLEFFDADNVNGLLLPFQFLVVTEIECKVLTLVGNKLEVSEVE